MIWFFLQISFIKSHVVFNEVYRNKLNESLAYNYVSVINKNQCTVHCMLDQKCMTFDYIEVDKKMRCNLYNNTVLDDGYNSIPGGTMYYIRQMSSCADWYNAGIRTNGVQDVVLMNKMKMKVLCIMEYGGGWMAFQRRYDGSVRFFNRKWKEFKHGFGNVNTEFWLGLEVLHKLTNYEEYDAMVIGKSFDDEIQTQYGKGFRIENEDNDYKAHIVEELTEKYSFFKTFDGFTFSSVDQDNDDMDNDYSCASDFGG